MKECTCFFIFCKKLSKKIFTELEHILLTLRGIYDILIIADSLPVWWNW